MAFVAVNNRSLSYRVMTAGWDGNKEDAPGFPKNGKWNVKYEGLKIAP